MVECLAIYVSELSHTTSDKVIGTETEFCIYRMFRKDSISLLRRNYN